MFGISGSHLVILAIILIIFGPKKLPELGHTLGKAMKNFKDSMAGIEEAKFRHLDSAPHASDMPKSEPTTDKTDDKKA